MEKSTEERINQLLSEVSKLFDVEVALIADPQNENKVTYHFDMNAVVSKMIALWVYCGFNVPSSFAPPYNRVHADIEFWKHKFDSLLISDIQKNPGE